MILYVVESSDASSCDRSHEVTPDTITIECSSVRSMPPFFLSQIFLLFPFFKNTKRRVIF